VPNPITHIVLGKKIHQQFFSHLDFPAFIVGTSFPDIRYISGLTRTQTHLQDTHLKDIDTKNPFLAGFQIHSLIDQIVNNLGHQKMISLSQEINMENVTSFKLYQDKILYSKINNWPQIASFFDCVYPQETEMGVSIKNIQEWHTWLQKYFKEGVNKKTLKRLSKFYEQPKLEENIIKSFNELDKNPLIKKDILELTKNIISLVEKE